MRETIRTTSGQMMTVLDDLGAAGVRAYPVGGGFRYLIPRDRIGQRNVEIPADDFDFVEVGFYGEPWGRAWVHRVHRWNGFVEPLVPATELESFVEKQNRFVDGSDCPEDDMRFAWDGVDGPLVVTYGAAIASDGEEETIEIPADRVEINGDTLTVYQLGLGLTWENMGGAK